MFSDISHNFETVLVYKGLNETVIVHRSSNNFTTLCREHVPREMVSNLVVYLQLKQRAKAEGFFRVI
jgi:hypothetical protein